LEETVISTEAKKAKVEKDETQPRKQNLPERCRAPLPRPHQWRYSRISDDDQTEAHASPNPPLSTSGAMQTLR